MIRLTRAQVREIDRLAIERYLIPGIVLMENAARGAADVACDMLGAITFVHAKGGFFVPNGVEFVLSLCAVSLALALAGAGEWSVDATIARRRAATP